MEPAGVPGDVPGEDEHAETEAMSRSQPMTGAIRVGGIRPFTPRAPRALPAAAPGIRMGLTLPVARGVPAMAHTDGVHLTAAAAPEGAPTRSVILPRPVSALQTPA